MAVEDLGDDTWTSISLQQRSTPLRIASTFGIPKLPRCGHAAYCYWTSIWMTYGASTNAEYITLGDSHFENYRTVLLTRSPSFLIFATTDSLQPG